MTEPRLIKKVIEATGMELCSANKTPTSQTALGSDPEGSPIKKTWKYSSVVIILLYLSTETRPDIAFAVSQVAQFNSNPKQSHASAVKMIMATSDKGIIFTPTTGFKVVCYVDADSAGLHGRDPQELSASTLEQDTSCSSAPALSFGKANFKQRLCSVPFMQNMMPSLQPSKTSSSSNKSSKNWYTAYI